LPEIDYVSPNNYLPDDHAPVNGLVIEDTDVTRADVLENIFGSDLDDLIAAGLNDDTVHRRAAATTTSSPAAAMTWSIGGAAPTGSRARPATT
jgi:hypothetical protein